MEKEENLKVLDKSRLLKEANVSLVIDSYGELFSDFDPRNYSERTISDDFLFECRKIIFDRDNQGFELRISIPEDKRNIGDEIKIKKRLRNYFSKHVIEKRKEISNITRNGLILTSIGFVLMILGAWVLFSHFLEGTFISAVLLVALEPAGWFFFWEGLAKTLFIYEEHDKKRKDFKFLEKMSKSRINFISI